MMMTPKKNSPRFVFFGTGHVALLVLDELLNAGLVPSVIVTSPDAPAGRGLIRKPSLVAQHAEQEGVAVLKPEHVESVAHELPASDVFIVVDYGAMLPSTIIDMPNRGTLNMHPSLLPRLRGPSPIRSAILTDEKNTGVTIIRIDNEMDHGPIVAQKKITVPEWPPHAGDLEELLARSGGKLLAEIMPHWVRGDIEAHPQNHDVATYSAKLKKSDAELDLSADAYTNLLKIRAYEGWPNAYAFFERPSTRSGQAGKKIRVAILNAHIENNALVIDRVIPEGKRAMTYEEFLRSGARLTNKAI